MIIFIFAMTGVCIQILLSTFLSANDRRLTGPSGEKIAIYFWKHETKKKLTIDEEEIKKKNKRK